MRANLGGKLAWIRPMDGKLAESLARSIAAGAIEPPMLEWYV